MAYELSFTQEFFWGNGDLNDSKSKQPTSVYQALHNIPKRQWNRMCKEVFNCKPEFVNVETVMSKIFETNTCRDLSTPVEVYIDEEGWYSILVY